MTEAERAKEALLEFVRALARRQARIDFEEEQGQGAARSERAATASFPRLK